MIAQTAIDTSLDQTSNHNTLDHTTYEYDYYKDIVDNIKDYLNEPEENSNQNPSGTTKSTNGIGKFTSTIYDFFTSHTSSNSTTNGGSAILDSSNSKISSGNSSKMSNKISGSKISQKTQSSSTDEEISNSVNINNLKNIGIRIAQAISSTITDIQEFNIDDYKQHKADNSKVLTYLNHILKKMSITDQMKLINTMDIICKYIDSLTIEDNKTYYISFITTIMKVIRNNIDESKNKYHILTSEQYLELIEKCKTLENEYNEAKDQLMTLENSQDRLTDKIIQLKNKLQTAQDELQTKKQLYTITI